MASLYINKDKKTINSERLKTAGILFAIACGYNAGLIPAVFQ